MCSNMSLQYWLSILFLNLAHLIALAIMDKTKTALCFTPMLTKVTGKGFFAGSGEASTAAGVTVGTTGSGATAASGTCLDFLSLATVVQPPVINPVILCSTR